MCRQAITIRECRSTNPHNWSERVQANGGTVEFVHYADEGHLISKLENRIDSFTKMAEFLDRYLV